MQIHALWCHPRSVSTAFERIMRERGDLTVLHEPFMYHYYLTQSDRMFPDFRPEPGHPQTYAEIRAHILEAAEKRPVFFKDMAYYIVDDLPKDVGFLGEMTHAFLIRDPAEAALSYAKRDPDFTKTELGHEAQHRLYEALVAAGQSPLVITADQVRSAPEETMRRYWAHVGLPFVAEAFTWDDKTPEGWESVAEWHETALSSGRMKQPEARNFAAELATLGPPYTDYADHHRPFYEALKEIAEAHQK